MHLQGCPHAAFHPPSSPPPSPPSLLLLPLLPSRRHCHHSSLLLPPLPSLAASRSPPLPHPRRSAEPQPPPAAPRKLEGQVQDVPVACGNELQMVLFSTHRCEIAPPLGGLHTTSMPCTSSCWGTPNPWAHCLGATALVTTAHLCSTCLAGWATNMQPKPAQHLAASCRLGHAILSARLSASTCHLRQGAPHQPISCFTHQCPTSKKCKAPLWAPSPARPKALPAQPCPPMPRTP